MIRLTIAEWLLYLFFKYAFKWVVVFWVFFFQMMILSAVSLWRGVPETLDAVATSWTLKVLTATQVTEWYGRIYNIFWYAGLIIMIYGWICWSALVGNILAVLFAN